PEARPTDEGNVTPGEAPGREQRRRQDAALLGALRTGKVVAEYHRSTAQGIGQHLIVVEAGAQLAERPLEARLPLELPLADRLQHLEPGAYVGLGENYVEADHGRPIVVGQPTHQRGHCVAPPGT